MHPMVPLWARPIIQGAKKNAPQILSVATGIGTAVTAYCAAKGTIKAVRIVDELREGGYEPTNWEIFKATWKCYISSLASFSFTIASIILTRRITAKQLAAYGTLYSISQTALKEAKEQYQSLLKEKEVQKIEDGIAQKHIDEQPPGTAKYPIYDTGNGTTLFRDDMFGQYFFSDYEAVRKAMNDINYELIGDTYATLNDLYDCLRVPYVYCGSHIYWNVGEKIEFDLSEIGRAHV